MTVIISFYHIEIHIRFWITGFNPKMIPGTVHHMAVAGCSERPPATDHNVWNCGANGNPVLEPQYPSFVVSVRHGVRECWTEDWDISFARLVLMETSLPPHCSYGQEMELLICCRRTLDFQWGETQSINILFCRSFFQWHILYMLLCCCQDYFNS